jgi:hypothetical protein
VSDSPNISDQTALTTSSGRIWLITGAILAAISIGVLIPLIRLNPATAVGGIVAVVVFYTAMFPVRFGIQTLRVRLWTMAILMGLIAVAFLVTAGIIYTVQVNAR